MLNLLSVGGRAARPGAANGGRHDYYYHGEGTRGAHCAEKFESEGSPVPTIVKGGKLEQGNRPSAGEEVTYGTDLLNLGILRRPFELSDRK